MKTEFLFITLIAVQIFLASVARANNPPDNATVISAEKSLLKAMVAELQRIDDPFEQKSANEWICGVQSNVGDIAGAFDTASRIPEFDSPSRNLCWTAISDAPPKRVSAADRKLLEQLPEPYKQRFAASVMADSNDIDGAMASLNQINDSQACVSAYCDLATKLLLVGAKQPARRLCHIASALVETMPNERQNPVVLNILENLVKADDTPAAFALVYRLPNPSPKQQENQLPAQDPSNDEKLLTDIARWQAAGDSDGARTTAKMLTLGSDLVSFNEFLANTEVKLLAQAGEFSKAKRLANGIAGDAFNASETSIAIEQAKFGDWDAVQETLSIFPESLDQANRYLNVALSFAQEGYFQDVKRAIAVAMAMKDKPKFNDYESLDAVHMIAALAISGDINGAIEAANLTGQNDYSRAPRNASMRCWLISEAANLLDMDNLQTNLYFQIPETQFFQVFPEAIEPNLLGKIGALIAKLDSDSPDEREKATADLEAMGPPAILYLAHLDPSVLSPEQQARTRYFRAPIRLFSADEIASRRRDLLFLSQAMVNEDRRVRAAALEQLQKNLGHPIEFNLDADIDARRDAVRALHLFPPISTPRPF